MKYKVTGFYSDECEVEADSENDAIMTGKMMLSGYFDYYEAEELEDDDFDEDEGGE